MEPEYRFSPFQSSSWDKWGNRRGNGLAVPALSEQTNGRDFLSLSRSIVSLSLRMRRGRWDH